MCPHGNFPESCEICLQDTRMKTLRINLDDLPVDRVADIENKAWEPLQPDSERAKELDRQLSEVSDFFEGTGIDWRIDGALNLSLREGRYLRNHKDIDLGISIASIEKLLERAEKMGYEVLYVDRSQTMEVAKERGFVQAERVSKDEIIGGKEKLILVKNTETGPDFRNYMDVHVLKLNENGQKIEEPGVVFPAEFTDDLSVEKEGKEIKLEPTLVFAHHKLWSALNRPTMFGGESYDWRDLEALADQLRRQGKMDELESVRVQIPKAYQLQLFSGRSEDQKAKVSKGLERLQAIFA